jgi:hypothetical protein
MTNVWLAARHAGDFGAVHESYGAGLVLDLALPTERHAAKVLNKVAREHRIGGHRLLVRLGRRAEQLQGVSTLFMVLVYCQRPQERSSTIPPSRRGKTVLVV